MSSSSWCRFMENPKSKFKSLPSGKPLSDVTLKNALSDVFKTYASNAEKVVALGGSQANTNFNRIVSLKASKSNHYSGSGRLLYIVDASVNEKNEGHKFFITVSFLCVSQLFCIFSIYNRTCLFVKLNECDYIIFS